ncbi:hypothetical protein M3Y98_00194400 [Aphelenchoides besseyi]|nr:hypothetical protein M3Y98_00194400 [Aphelenchoides besseyi]
MTVVIIKIVLLFAFIHSIYAHFSFGFDDPNVDLSKSLNCYTGAYYGYSENAMNFETRRCNPGIKYCGVILHSKATNDLPNELRRSSVALQKKAESSTPLFLWVDVVYRRYAILSD